MSIAFDPKKRTAHRWQSIRRKALRESGAERGLSGAALEAAVMAIAASDSSLVAIQSGVS